MLNEIWSGVSQAKFYHYLLTLMVFQTCIHYFLVLNTKEDILKNVGNQTFAVSH